MKSSKKSFSVLMQNILYKAINENKNECLSFYFKKIKNLQEPKNTQQFLYNDIPEEDQEEIENKNVKKKLSMMSTSSKLSSKLKKLTEKEKEKEREKAKEELENIILAYKLLKNLYLCLDIDKKNSAIDKLAEISLDSGEKMFEFFNQVFNYLNDKYDIFEKISDDFELYNEEEEIDLNRNEIILNNNTNNNETSLTEEEKEANQKICKYVEYIKSICIRFIDEMTFGKMKNLKNDNSKVNAFKQGAGGVLNRSIYSRRTTSATSLFKSSSTSNLSNLRRSSLKQDFSGAKEG